MSLDVCLYYLRDNRLTQVEEGSEECPDASIDEQETEYVYEANITHNLGRMAQAAGIYEALWRPEETGWTQAKDIIKVLEKGLAELYANPEHYEQFNASNGWGTYQQFVPFVERYLSACKEHTDAMIYVSR